MNKKTLVRFHTSLRCGHTVIYDVKQPTNTVVFCFRCDATRVVSGYTKVARHTLQEVS